MTTYTVFGETDRRLHIYRGGGHRIYQFTGIRRALCGTKVPPAARDYTFEFNIDNALHDYRAGYLNLCDTCVTHYEHHTHEPRHHHKEKNNG